MVLIHSFHSVLFVPRVIHKASTRERYCYRFAACLVMVSQVCPLPSSLFPWFFARSPWERPLFRIPSCVQRRASVQFHTQLSQSVSQSFLVVLNTSLIGPLNGRRAYLVLEVRTPDRHRSVCGSTSACLDSRRRYGIGRSGERTPEEGTVSRS